jgi:hypothetical protein
MSRHAAPRADRELATWFASTASIARTLKWMVEQFFFSHGFFDLLPNFGTLWE